MSDPFLAEIRMFGFDYAPVHWAFCNGQILSIAQNTDLFSLLGTNFGGDGVTTFGLPNFQGCIPIHWGQGAGLTDRTLGETGGSATVVLLESEMPAHNHAAGCTSAAAQDYRDAAFAATSGSTYSTSAGSPVPLAVTTIEAFGGSAAHDNLQPYVVVNFCIALEGIFPPRS